MWYSKIKKLGFTVYEKIMPLSFNRRSITVPPIFVTQTHAYEHVHVLFSVRQSFNFFGVHVERAAKWLSLLSYPLSRDQTRLSSGRPTRVVGPTCFGHKLRHVMLGRYALERLNGLWPYIFLQMFTSLRNVGSSVGHYIY